MKLLRIPLESLNNAMLLNMVALLPERVIYRLAGGESHLDEFFAALIADKSIIKSITISIDFDETKLPKSKHESQS